MDRTLTGLLFGCAEATDSTPHLILADWLEDHDQPHRATFVRLQCQLADWVPDWKERRERIEWQTALHDDHRAAWLGTIAVHCTKIEWVRGLARITVPSRTFASVAFRKAFDAHAGTALIERVRIIRGKRSLARVVNLEQAEAIPAFAMANLELTDEDVLPVYESPRLSRLVRLDLSNNQLTLAPPSRELVCVELRNNHLGTEAAPGISRLLASARIRDCDLTGNPAADRFLARRMNKIGSRVMNSLGMEFVRIPAGSFRMGSDTSDPVARPNEKPQHAVTLTQPTWLARFAVTQAQYQRIMGDNPSRFPEDNRRPVEMMTWDNAVEFLRRLSLLPEEVAAGRSYRLPTEAEWEHACRAGTFSPFYFPGPIPPTSNVLNYDGRSPYVYGGAKVGPYLRRPAEVGFYEPNPFDLFEMHGNVWEWCSNFYSEHYSNKPATDPTGPTSGGDRVRRGGCWDAIGSYCRAAHRNGQSQSDGNRFTGFRPVLMRSA